MGARHLLSVLVEDGQTFGGDPALLGSGMASASTVFVGDVPEPIGHVERLLLSGSRRQAASRPAGAREGRLIAVLELSKGAA
jgi:hypothetical protein